MKFKVVALALGLVLAVSASAGPYGDLQRQLTNETPKQVVETFSEFAVDHGIDPDQIAPQHATLSQRAQALRDYVGIRASLESPDKSSDSSVIKEIKKSPLYRKGDSDGGDNWLARAANRIRFNLPDNVNAPRVGAPPTDFLKIIVYLVWALLILLALGFLFFAIRYFALKAQRAANRKSNAMLDDDEPERSLDEWLELAAKLEMEGRFREAVRCLYVACLLRMDEHRVARFDRTETNWEHYRRIMASPANPKEFDFLGPTREFDRLWYGNHPSTAVEVRRFRDAYTELTQLLTRSGASAR